MERAGKLVVSREMMAQGAGSEGVRVSDKNYGLQSSR